jgi:Holliday junction resolvase RusA-like endonuclease
MKKSDPAFRKIVIRSPLLATAGKKVLERKQRLRDAIKDELGERGLSRAKRQCSDKHLFLNVKYYLLKTTVAGTSQKDLDNLIKILFDVIPDYIAQHSKAEEFKGLGLIKDDQDIFGICCEKEIIEPPEEERMELEISVMRD